MSDLSKYCVRIGERSRKRRFPHFKFFLSAGINTIGQRRQVLQEILWLDSGDISEELLRKFSNIV